MCCPGWRLVIQSLFPLHIKNFFHDKTQITLLSNLFPILGTRLELVRLAPTDFLTTIVFTTIFLCLWSGLYLHHCISALDVLCQVSTPSFSGLARYSHLTGFTEFTGFYIKDFSLSTQFSKSVVYTVSPPELTNLQDYYTITIKPCKNILYNYFL